MNKIAPPNDMHPKLGAYQTYCSDFLLAILKALKKDTKNAIHIRKIDDNTYTVDVAVQVSKMFFAWIVGTQGKVRIKAPEKVVTEFSDFVAKVKEVY